MLWREAGGGLQRLVGFSGPEEGLGGLKTAK